MKKQHLLIFLLIVGATITLDSCQKEEDTSIHAELVDGPTFNATIPDDATAVVFEYGSKVTSGTVLSTIDSPVPIYGNLDGTIWRVSTSVSRINANPNCYRMFSSHGQNLPELETIDFGSGFNTSNVTDMSFMFCNLQSLTSLNLSEEYE